MSGKLIVNELIPDNIDNTLTLDGKLNLGTITDVEDIINTMKATLDSYASKITPPGTINPFAGPIGNIPDGWLLCDGKAYSRTTYSDLYGAIGTYWGEPAGDQFNVPDLRGQFLRGTDFQRTDESTWNKKDPGSEIGSSEEDKRTNLAGAEVGSLVGSTQSDAFQGHKHETSSGSSYSNATDLNPRFGGSTTIYTSMGGYYVLSTYYSIYTGDTVSDTTYDTHKISTETRSKNAAVNYIIKY